MREWLFAALALCVFGLGSSAVTRAQESSKRMEFKDFLNIIDGAPGSYPVAAWSELPKFLKQACEFDDHPKELKDGLYPLSLKGICHLQNNGKPLYSVDESQEPPLKQPFDYPIELLGARVGIASVELSNPDNIMRTTIQEDYDLSKSPFGFKTGKCSICDPRDERAEHYITPKEHYIDVLKDGGSAGDTYFFTFMFQQSQPEPEADVSAAPAQSSFVEDGVEWSEIEDEDKLSDHPQNGLQAVFSNKNSAAPAIVLEAYCIKDPKHFVKLKATGFTDTTLKKGQSFKVDQGINDDGTAWQRIPYRYKIDVEEAKGVIAVVWDYINSIEDITAAFGTPKMGVMNPELEKIDQIRRLRFEIPFDSGDSVLVDFSPRSQSLSKFLDVCKSLASQ